MSGKLSFDIDGEGIVRVRGTGMWEADQTAIHFIDLHRAVVSLRAVRKKVLVLVDLRDAAVQTNEVAEAVRHGTGRIYRAADFVAVVCTSQLLIMQIKRSAQVPNLQTFHEMESALAWLRARRDDPSG